MTQTWYRFDADDGAYVGFAVCEQSQLVDATHYTATPPPSKPDAGMCWVMSADGAWSLTHDYRWQTWHDPATGMQVTITRAGDAPPTGYVQGAAPVPDPQILASAQSSALDVLKRRRDAFIAAGFTWDGSPFDSDDRAQARILGLFTAAQANAGTWPQAWRLADNTWRSLSAADAAAIFGAMSEHLRSAFEQFATYETAIKSATEPAAVQAALDASTFA